MNIETYWIIQCASDWFLIHSIKIRSIRKKNKNKKNQLFELCMLISHDQIVFHVYAKFILWWTKLINHIKTSYKNCIFELVDNFLLYIKRSFPHLHLKYLFRYMIDNLHKSHDPKNWIICPYWIHLSTPKPEKWNKYNIWKKANWFPIAKRFLA